MDISKRRLKSISTTNMLATLLFLLINTPMLYGTSNTFVIGEIECSCSGTTAVCSGDSEDGEEEIKDVLSQLLQNCSSTNDLTLTINAGTWPNISFNHFKLQNLTIGYGLEVLNQDSFYGLNSSLSSLNLSHNDIEFFYTQHSPFSILENLKVLNLDYNDLTDFRHDIFENLTKLEVLSVSGNSFTGLHANLLENMTVIQTLILDHNKKIISLSDLNVVSSTLVNLSAKNCSINGSLETDSLSGITNLKYADFSSNKLILVNAFALDRLHNLETLNLSSNKIETLKNYSFSSLHNLVELDLKGNDISVIEEFSFANLTQLRVLNLANNKLYGFSKNYASDLYSLEKINLENNDIHYIEDGSFSICIQLKELLLKGNAFGCWHCETMYIVGLLTNDTLFKKEDADSITCAEPDEMKDMPVAEVTLEKLEDYCDPVDLTSETPSEDTDNSAVTPIIIPQSTSESTDTTHEATTPSITTTITPGATTGETETSTATEVVTTTPFITTSTTKIIPASTNATTEETEINTTTEVVTLPMTKTTTERITETSTESIPRLTDTTTEAITLPISEPTPAASTSRSTDTTTEAITLPISEPIPAGNAETSPSSTYSSTDTTTEAITLPISEPTPAGNVGTSPPSTTESTTLSITETTTEMTKSISQFAPTSLPDMDKTGGTTTSVIVTQNTTTLTSITTEPPTVPTAQTDLNREETSTARSTQTGFVSTDTPDYSELSKAFTTTALPTKKMSGSELIRIVDYSVLNDTICVRWGIKWKILNEQWIINKLKCGVEIQHSKGKTPIAFKNCPTSEHEILECAIPEKQLMSNMYRFCVYVYVSNFKKLKNCPKNDSLAATEKSFKYSSTTDIPTPQSLPPTQQPTFAPFKVVKFDVNFNYTKSFVDVNWVVNRNERNAICTLDLILMSHNFNYSEAVFSCENNSYKIQNIKQQAFQVCLRNSYRGHYAPLMCKSSEPLPYHFRASSMKDDGYKNSALIAVICLLILIVLIVIVILLKKILKKRSESDLYNVSAEEKNVLRRQASASLRPEPCVRYSYTLREQMEI